MYTQKDGKFLVETARKTIESWFENKVFETQAQEKFQKKAGVFVTLKTTAGELRGCVGHPRAVKPLIVALKDSAIGAAFHDGRFNPVKKDELEKIMIEVDVLSQPKLLTGERTDYPKKIKIGKHGLILDAGVTSGLLLPQIAAECGWDAEEFLAQVCWKAGLEPSVWLLPRVKVYTFEAQRFAEKTPGGEVIEKK